MAEIEQLFCGKDLGPGAAGAALTQLGTSLETFGGKSLGFLAGDEPDNLPLFGPFCARVFMENACAALLGRIDPFRVMYLHEFQSQEEYDLAKRAKTAFAWTGDVISPGQLLQEMWSVDHDIAKVSRSLLSQHMDVLVWRPAIESVLDFMATTGNPISHYGFDDVDPQNFIHGLRPRISALYSILSKGVHWEFFSTSLMMDDPTIKNSIRETFAFMLKVGIISHFIPTAYCSMDRQLALETYVTLREKIA
ncbi:MAG: hypothetical protein EON56_01670 [Alphaproteobacteria bacterium]|nr:MAG: hypothetical protein EON56_01670 [Alphaproteobacteria bacterium]